MTWRSSLFLLGNHGYILNEYLRCIAAQEWSSGAECTIFRWMCWYQGIFHIKRLIAWIIIPPAQRSCWGGILVSLRPSVRLSVCPSVRPSRMPCPLCIIYSYGWILFILGTNDHYHERVCRAPWPLTLTYIFKVIWPWLRKSCPLCSVYSSGWILPIFGTKDHYH